MERIRECLIRGLKETREKLEEKIDESNFDCRLSVQIDWINKLVEDLEDC